MPTASAAALHLEHASWNVFGISRSMFMASSRGCKGLRPFLYLPNSVGYKLPSKLALDGTVAAVSHCNVTVYNMYTTLVMNLTNNLLDRSSMS